MSDKFRRGRAGTEKYFRKHGDKFRNRKRGLDRDRHDREYRPGRYDPDARYS